MTASGLLLLRAYVGMNCIGARPVERYEGDEVLELGGLTLRSASLMPSDSNWNTPVGVAAGEHLVGLLVVERQRGHVEPHAGASAR